MSCTAITSAAQAAVNNSYQVSAADPFHPVTTVGETFYSTDISVDTASGEVYLSGSADGTQPYSVDDVMEIDITHPDGTSEPYTQDFSGDCSGNYPSAPVDLKQYLEPGANQLHVIFHDSCGDLEGNTAVFLTGDGTFSGMNSGASADVFAALGDSYSSGEGLAPFLSGSDTIGNSCHRSSKAYSQVFAKTSEPKLKMEFHACSGAYPETSWATPNPDQSNPSEMPQRHWLNSNVATVTMTYGGNDLDWPTTLTDCTKVQLGPTHTTVFGSPAKCNADLNGAAAKIEAMYQNLVPVYLDALQDAPNAQIRVLTYPPLFPAQRRSKSGCAIFGGSRDNLRTLQLTIAADVVSRFAALEEDANRAIVNAVNLANTTYALASPGPSRLQLVDVTHEFGGLSGHTVNCGDRGRPNPWINAIRIQTFELPIIAIDLRNGNYYKVMHMDLFDSYSDSFHPTVAGQKAMAAALATSLP